MSPLVSIIIPTYNRDRLLGETLDSILSQTYQEWECLVIDDGSTDHTPELMEFYRERDARISYFKRPKDRLKGANACRNYGFELSKGEYVNWFDDDDLMHPKKLELQINALEHSEDNFSVCQSIFFSEVTVKTSSNPIYSIFSRDIFYDYLQTKAKWLTQPPLWKRDFLITQDALFDEELQAAQEWEFHCRMLYSSPCYNRIETPLVFIRKHSSSITHNDNGKERFWWYFIARLKIYKNPLIVLDRKSCSYLENYLLNSFKRLIVKRHPFTMRAYWSYLWPSKRIRPVVKIHALLAIVSFRLISKGNFFLQKIKYKTSNKSE